MKLKINRIDWFLTGMIAAILVASLAPDVGRSGGLLRLDSLGDVGIFALFFLHGIGLSRDNLKDGASNWRLHLTIQLVTFVVFPIWWVILAATLGSYISHDLLLGFFYLSALPSTVSSSVAMTSLARGNIAAAVLNASLSTVLGVLITPILVSVVMQEGGGANFDILPTMQKIVVMLLFPFVLGHVLRPWLSELFGKIKHITMRFDRAVIVMLVWTAFSDSVTDGLWKNHGPTLLVEACLGVALFLGPMLLFTRLLAVKLKFQTSGEIVAVFCGSTKSMASGLPMAKLLFAGNPAIGVLIIPILLYHQIQLFVCTVIARRYAYRSMEENKLIKNNNEYSDRLAQDGQPV